jgi:hypothetical protein
MLQSYTGREIKLRRVPEMHIPDRTGRGDTIADAVISSMVVSIGSSNSSSGEIVSSDCRQVSV